MLDEEENGKEECWGWRKRGCKLGLRTLEEKGGGVGVGISRRMPEGTEMGWVGRKEKW